MEYTCRTGLRPVGGFESRCVFRRNSGSLTFDVPPTTRWRAVVRVLRSPVDALGCTLLPASCHLCGSPLPRLSSIPICDLCWAEFPALDGCACSRCGDALDENLDGNSEADLCRACRLAPPPFVRAVAAAHYQGRMKDAIHALKYDRLHPAVRELGRVLAQAIAQLEADTPQEMLVIPVPLHRIRYAQRGFNQSRSLAREALRTLVRTHPAWRLTLAPSALMRHKATSSQAGLSPRERRINLRGAFSVSDPAAVQGRDILLIDDILTTGATARAAALALRRAGAASVWVATLARARRTFNSSSSYAETPDSPPVLSSSPSKAQPQQPEGRSSPGQESFNQPSF
jgi:ComF family protein